MRLRWVLPLALIVAVGAVAISVRDRQPVRTEYCLAEVGETRAQLDMEQARWTSLMAALAQRRGMPPRATTIAIATAFQESKIHNIDYGDRDSLGLFQQRPSQGWGTAEQVQDPYYSIEKFYDGLAKVDGYEGMQITDAAQAVQRSAFPDAYGDHEGYARALASALRGYSPAAFTCVINPGAGGSTSAIVDDVFAGFGEIPADRSGDDVLFPLTGSSDDVNARGWGLAHYLVANASRLGIARIEFDRYRWSAEASDAGWVETSDARADVVVAAVN